MREIKENNLTFGDKTFAIVDFFATWCGPCKSLAPILQGIEEKTDNVEILKCDIEDNEELAEKYKIMNVPTMLFFKDGELVDKIVGLAPEKNILEKLK